MDQDIRPINRTHEERSRLGPQILRSLGSFIENPVAGAYKAAMYLMYAGVIVDGLFPQMAIAVLGGRDPYVQPILKFALPFGAFVIWLMRGGQALKPIGYPALALLIYLLLDTVSLSLTQGSFTEAAVGLYVGYFTFAIIMALQTFDLGLSELVMARVLLISFAINLLLELVQHYLNDPVLPTESVDGNFLINSYQFFSGVRAFGLFGSISAAGSFGCLIAAIAIGKYKQPWSKARVCFVYLCCILMVYVVELRLAFIELGLCTLAAVALRFKARSAFTSALPYTNLGLAGIFLAWLSGYATHSVGLADASSLLERLEAWQSTIAALSGLPFSKLMFGTGSIQHWATTGRNSGTILDSMYLEIVVHIGLAGLGFILFYYHWLWAFALRRVRQTGSPLAIGVAASWSSLLGIGIINLMYPNVSTYFIGLVLCAGGSVTLGWAEHQESAQGLTVALDQNIATKARTASS